MNIAIVEDNYDIALLWRLTFSEDAEKVFVAGSVQEAKEFPWPLISYAIVDFSLHGGQTGADLLKWLDEEHPHVRSVLVSAISPSALGDLGTVVERLVKPTSADEIRRVLFEENQ